MSYLVDTNVLLRLVQKSSLMHTDARMAFVTLREQNDRKQLLRSEVSGNSILFRYQCFA